MGSETDLTDTPARALNSASNINRRRLCPGSAFAECGLPEEKSEYAAEGTLLHWLDANPYESRDELSDLQRYVLERNEKFRKKFVEQQMDRLSIPANALCKRFTESRKSNEFWLCDESGIPLNPGVPGHPDLVLYWPDYKVAIVWDSKFGRIPVTQADLNDQIRCYVVMFAEHFECDTILGAISQPWLKSPHDFHFAEFTAELIPAFKSDLIGVIRRTEEPGAPRHAFVEACRYCKAKATCPQAIEILERFSELQIDDVKNFTPEQLENLWPTAEYAKSLHEAIKTKLKVFAAQGKLTKYELGKAQKNRSITDYKEAVKILVESGLASQELIDSCSKISLADLEKAAAKPRKVTQKKSKEDIEVALSGLIHFEPKEPPLKIKIEVEE